jgi:hypothetical protein
VIEAIVLAGGRTDRLPFSEKADLLLHGRAMVDYVVAALQDVPEIDNVRVHRGAGDQLVPNLLEALAMVATPEDDYVLVSSCDIPFLTPEAVQDFLARCDGSADLYYPIVSRDACEARFPGVRRTYAKLREGTFTGGNLFLVRPSVLPPLAKRLERLFALRKSPLRLSRELGYRVVGSFLLSALFGTLSVTSLEQKVGHIAGLKAKAVISSYPEIGTDIDKESDLSLAERVCLPKTRKL